MGWLLVKPKKHHAHKIEIKHTKDQLKYIIIKKPMIMALPIECFPN